MSDLELAAMVAYGAFAQGLTDPVPWASLPSEARADWRAVADAVAMVTGQQIEHYGVTLATLHSLVAGALSIPAGSEHAHGYERAMRDVKAVLDKHGSPPGEPVHFGATT